MLMKVQDESRRTLLSGWVNEARRRYLEGAVLLGVEMADVERVRTMVDSAVQLYPLFPAYEELCQRFAECRNAGVQPDLYAGDFESRLMQEWCSFFWQYVRGFSSAQELRLVLHATIGLGNDVNPRVTASNTLLEHVRVSRLPPAFNIPWGRLNAR